MIVIVGGHSRHTGKTSVICALIRALPEARWTAIKITPHAHQQAGVFEEADPGSGRDTARYLAAGAARAFLVRTQAVAGLAEILRNTGNAIIESNSAPAWLRPDLSIMVIDPAIEEFKPSARAFGERAEARVVVDRGEPRDPAGFAALIELVRTKMTV